MSAPAKDTNEPKSNRNDWDQDEDDNWDDWGKNNDDDFQEALNYEPETKTKTEVKHDINNAADSNNDNNRTSSSKNEGNQEKTTKSAVQTPLSKSNWGNIWGGVSSVLTSATEGLGNITSTVSQSFNQVIGVPDPEELARINKASEEARKEEIAKETAVQNSDNKAQESNGTPVFGLNLVSGVTTLGSKVLNTGLDTLEGIGKKTMDILQENDPLLMNKRKLLGLNADKPNLSEILKEAKNDADQLENTLKELKIENAKKQLRFDLLFENHCGLVHFEALELLSKESALKIGNFCDAVSGNALIELKETIDEVKELLELEDLENESDGEYNDKELNANLLATLEDLDLPINFNDITNVWAQCIDWLNVNAPESNEEQIFAKGLTSLAETCALSMNKLHKIAELLLVKEHHSTANEVDSIVQLCKHFNGHMSGLTNRFCATLTAKNNEDAKEYISRLFAEMLVAVQHIETALKLFLPILQIGAV